MRTVMAAIRRNLLKKASRVADEAIATTAAPPSPPSRWNNGPSFFCSLLLAPFSLLSCLSSHPPNIDGVWVSAELPQTSELTHLMVRDSLRYAILM